MDQIRVLLIAPGMASFVKKDQLILSRLAELDTLVFRSAKGIKLLFALIAQFFSLIIQISRYNIIFIWFADYHSFLPILLSKLFGKKTIIVLGGTDVNCIPELGYGFCSNRIRKFMTLYSISKCDLLLPVDESLASTLRNRMPEVQDRLSVVPTCFDPALWFCDTTKENLVLTVGIFNTWQRARIKGIDLFVEVARLLPQFRFEVVRSANNAESLLSIPSNVRVHTERLSDMQLRQLYSRAKVYAQLSLSEGLPSSVCEAMLCECIPVGTDVGGMKSAISEFGIVMSSRDPKLIAATIERIIESENGRDGRQYIEKNFSFQLREKRITAAFSRLIQST